MTHGRDIAERRETMFEPGYREKVVNYCSGVAYTYRDVAGRPLLPTGIGGPAIGDRAPDVDLESGGTLFDRLRHPYFTVLAMVDGPGLAPLVGSIEECFGRVVHVEALPMSKALSRRYGASDGRLFLIRPDGYIGFTCGAEEAGQLEAHLRRTLTS
jgi:hypothetical protein